MLQTVILPVLGIPVFVLVFLIPPTGNLPNSILKSVVASWWKTQLIESHGSQQMIWVRDYRF